jgi:phytoene/squalene synthetase
MKEQYISIFNSLDFNKIIDHPNILIAAAFWDQDRYQAARICYKYMRAIDDLIDCHKSANKSIAESEKKQFMAQVSQWISLAHGNENPEKKGHELLDTIRTFHIPLWPLEKFATSMIYDIHHDGFQTLDDFISYSQGASVAPASIFVHLSGLINTKNGYEPPSFDVKSAATPCAMFSYLVHIIRDFQKDQFDHLNYFANDLLAKNHLCTADLTQIAHGGGIKEGFRLMIREYLNLADQYRQSTYRVIQDIWPMLEPKYRLSLLIIFNLYLMVFERIDPEKGNFNSADLNPTPDEIRNRVYKTILGFRE